MSSTTSAKAVKNIIIAIGRTVLSIQSITNDYDQDSLKDTEAEGLPEAFLGVFVHLPVAEVVFKTMSSRLDKAQAMGRIFAEDKNHLANVQASVHKCEITVRKLDKIYKAVVPGDAKTRKHRYRQSTEGYETVEGLMKGLVGFMLEVAGSPLGIISKSEEQELKMALEAVSKLSISLEEEEESAYVYYITNSGSGLQPVHAGRGNQAIHGHNMGGVFNGSTHVHSGNPGEGQKPQGG
ncbi:hypothetical protein N0V82_004338 [Gnomoniopsis sp. IMI 355080]|nr:hypothetical protein N0V82_004338 [Gnomoniopsis sp. IMI 355080]